MRTLVKSVLIAGFTCVSIFAQAQSREDGIKLYNYNRFESAKKVLAPLASSDATSNYYLGLCELALEKNDEAKALFQKYPDDYQNNAGLARVYFKEKNIQEAVSTLQKVASKAKKKDYKPLQVAADAITYTDGGDPNMAIEWYKKAMEVERTGDLHIGLGDAYRKIQGGGGNAMNNYEYAETFDATKSLANQKMGNLWYAAKNYDSALSKYARASQLDDKNPLPYKSLADAYYRVKKYKISKENIEKYLELSDQTADDQMQYANTLYLAKEYQPAINKMQELIAKGIEKPYMFRVIGFSQFELKDYKSALVNMDKLFAKQLPEKIIPQDYIYYGKILLTDSTKASNADSYFTKGIAADTSTDKSSVYREIAEAYKDAQNYKSAAKWYKSITETNSSSVEALDYWWAGVMYYYAKDYANAEPMLTMMSQKYPEEPSSFYWLARNTIELKDKDYKNGSATPMFTKWLSMVNDDPAKKNDLIKAYTYLSMVAYNTKNKAEAEKFANKILTFDANNKTAKDILAALPSIK